jgi:hypothetical protein
MVIEDRTESAGSVIHTPHQNTTIQLGSVERSPGGGRAHQHEREYQRGFPWLSNNEATTQKNAGRHTSTAILG